MTCKRCKKKLRPGDLVMPLMTIVGNYTRGDFVSSPVGYIHVRCIALKELA